MSIDNVQDISDLANTIKWKWVGGLVAAVLGLMFLSSCWVQVGTDSVGIVLRFGEHVKNLQSGLHFKWPMGIDEVVQVQTEKQQKLEFGFRTQRPGVKTQYSSGNYKEESLMLTGDLNVVDVQWTVQYRIEDPEKYLFNIRAPRETLRYMSQATMREIVGDRTVSEVLTVGRTEVANKVEQKLQELCDEYEIGVRINQVIPQDITPPDKVQPSFNAVNEAQQEKERLINQAKGERNKKVPKARGEAQRKIRQAEGYAINRKNRARGEAARFEKMYRAYDKAPEVTRRRIYIETLQEALPKVERKLIIDGEGSDVVPLIPFDKMGKMQKMGNQ